MYRFTQNNNAITHDGMTVPIAMLHRAGLESFKQAYENGDVLPYETESEAKERELAIKAGRERTWRNMELTLVDHEINRIMDLEVATQESKAKEGELRAYRRALRDYPQQAEFPNCQRPSID